MPNVTLARRMEAMSGRKAEECWAVFHNSVRAIIEPMVDCRIVVMNNYLNMPNAIMMPAKVLGEPQTDKLAEAGYTRVRTTEIAGIYLVQQASHDAPTEEHEMDHAIRRKLAAAGMLDWPDSAGITRQDILDMAHKSDLAKALRGPIYVGVPKHTIFEPRTQGNWIVYGATPSTSGKVLQMKETCNGIKIESLTVRQLLEPPITDSIIKSTEGDVIGFVYEKTIYIAFPVYLLEKKEHDEIALYIFNKAAKIIEENKGHIKLSDMTKFLDEVMGSRSNVAISDLRSAEKAYEIAQTDFIAKAKQLESAHIAVAQLTTSHDYDMLAKRNIERLSKMPIQIVKLDLDGGKITFTTGPITIKHFVRHPEKRYHTTLEVERAIGRFEVTVSGKNNYIHVTMLGGYKKGYYCHPHILEGDPCQGNIAGYIPKLMKEGRISDAIVLMLQYLRSTFDEDAWGKHITAWPLLKYVKEEFEALVDSHRQIEVADLAPDKVDALQGVDISKLEEKKNVYRKNKLDEDVGLNDDDDGEL